MFLVIFKHCDVGDSFKAGFITVEVTKKTNFSMPSNLYWNSTCNYLKHLLNLLFQNGKHLEVALPPLYPLFHIWDLSQTLMVNPY